MRFCVPEEVHRKKIEIPEISGPKCASPEKEPTITQPPDEDKEQFRAMLGWPNRVVGMISERFLRGKDGTIYIHMHQVYLELS